MQITEITIFLINFQQFLTTRILLVSFAQVLNYQSSQDALSSKELFPMKTVDSEDYGSSRAHCFCSFYLTFQCCEDNKQDSHSPPLYCDGSNRHGKTQPAVSEKICIFSSFWMNRLHKQIHMSSDAHYTPYTHKTAPNSHDKQTYSLPCNWQDYILTRNKPHSSLPVNWFTLKFLTCPNNTTEGANTPDLTKRGPNTPGVDSLCNCVTIFI